MVSSVIPRNLARGLNVTGSRSFHFDTCTIAACVSLGRHIGYYAGSNALCFFRSQVLCFSPPFLFPYPARTFPPNRPCKATFSSWFRGSLLQQAVKLRQSCLKKRRCLETSPRGLKMGRSPPIMRWRTLDMAPTGRKLQLTTVPICGGWEKLKNLQSDSPSCTWASMLIKLELLC